MTLNIEAVERFANQHETGEDEQALIESVISNWTNDPAGLSKRLELNVGLKRSNPLYAKPEDLDEIDEALYDSIVEEISTQCELWGVDATKTSNELMNFLTLAGYRHYIPNLKIANTPVHFKTIMAKGDLIPEVVFDADLRAKYEGAGRIAESIAVSEVPQSFIGDVSTEHSYMEFECSGFNDNSLCSYHASPTMNDLLGSEIPVCLNENCTNFGEELISDGRTYFSQDWAEYHTLTPVD